MLDLKQIEINKISKYLQDVADKLKVQLKADGHFATGTTEKSIKVVSTGGAVKIRGLDSINKLTYGSPPQTTTNLYLEIIKWVSVKNIKVVNTKQFAILVTKKLQKFGYKVPNKWNDGLSVSKVVNTNKIQSDIQKIAGDEVALQVQSELIKNLKK